MMTKSRHPFKAPSGATIHFTELGFGTAPLGNLYRALSEEAQPSPSTRAWDAGIRYFDTAPLYGLGLSETRLNHFLRGKPRDDYVHLDQDRPPAQGRAAGRAHRHRQVLRHALAPGSLRLFL